MALVVKNLPTDTGDIRDVGLIPGSGRSHEEEMATHSSVLAWRIPWTEESHRVRHNWSNLACTHACTVGICLFITILTEGGRKTLKSAYNEWTAFNRSVTNRVMSSPKMYSETVCKLSVPGAYFLLINWGVAITCYICLVIMMMIQCVQARWCHYLQSSWYEKDAYLFKNMSFQKARCGWEKKARYQNLHESAQFRC